MSAKFSLRILEWKYKLFLLKLRDVLRTCVQLHSACRRFVTRTILVLRAYDPSGLRQESTALGATVLTCFVQRMQVENLGLLATPFYAQICTQVIASFSAFGHQTQVNAS